LRRQPSLRSQLNQIRLWVRQGRTDAWIAHKLDVSIEQLERFKRDHDLLVEGAAPGRPADPLSVPPPDMDVYEETEAEEEEEEEEPVGTLLEEPEEPKRREPRQRSRRPERSRAAAPPADEDEDEEVAPAARRRRRGRRGGRRRRRPSSYEATFDHGEDGYGLWLDPAIVDNPVYTEHWAGHRDIVVTFERDSITIRRAGSDAEATDDRSEPDELDDQ
jgi:hypothetical protein